jgi:hypothetical protein
LQWARITILTRHGSAAALIDNEILSVLLKDEQGARQVRIKQVNPLLIIFVLAIVLSGCGFAANRDMRAYNACMLRHSQEAAICDGPRQAYEVDLPVFQAKSAVMRPTASFTSPD